MASASLRAPSRFYPLFSTCTIIVTLALSAPYEHVHHLTESEIRQPLRLISIRPDFGILGVPSPPRSDRRQGSLDSKIKSPPRDGRSGFHVDLFKRSMDIYITQVRGGGENEKATERSSITERERRQVEQTRTTDCTNKIMERAAATRRIDRRIDEQMTGRWPVIGRSAGEQRTQDRMTVGQLPLLRTLLPTLWLRPRCSPLIVMDRGVRSCRKAEC